MNHQPAPWLPSFDIHEENGELVLHAGMEGGGAEDLEIRIPMPREEDKLHRCGGAT
jgi:hypothetical protein